MIKRRLAKLIDVKSIITIMIVSVFCILALKGDSINQDLLTIVTIIISFFFGTQSAKKSDSIEDNETK